MFLKNESLCNLQTYINFYSFKHLEQFLWTKQYKNDDSLKNSTSEFNDSKVQNFLKTDIFALKS